MNRELANRIVFLLACVGAFIALVIGVAHASGVQLPCGGIQNGCDVIGDPKNNQWFGVPIAFFGLALYVFVALMALSRAAIGVQSSPNLGAAMWVVLGSGTIVSIGLIAYAVTQLNATCLWCVSSATTMTLAFLVHSIGMAKDSPPLKSRWPFGAYFIVLAFALGSGGGYGYMLSQQAKHVAVKPVEVPEDFPLYTTTSHMTGNPDAKTTIVVFVDMYCPLCRKMSKWMAGKMNGEFKGKVRLVVRHWPVTNQHPYALTAAMLSEWAAENGKFWEFYQGVQKIDDENDVKLLIDVVKQTGLDVAMATKLMNDPTANRKYLEPVGKDMGAGNRLGVESTPHFFIEYSDKVVESIPGLGIQGKMESAEFRKRVLGSP